MALIMHVPWCWMLKQEMYWLMLEIFMIPKTLNLKVMLML